MLTRVIRSRGLPSCWSSLQTDRSLRCGARSRFVLRAEGSGGLDQEAAEALVNNIVAPLAQRIAEFGQMLRETQRDLVDSNGNVSLPCWPCGVDLDRLLLVIAAWSSVFCVRLFSSASVGIRVV